jgi:hypothetical protein
MREHDLQEPDMPRRGKSADTDQQKSQTPVTGKGQEKKGPARPEAGARGCAAANKLQGGGKNTASRQKLPSGPLGGSGRKTNLSRSS